MVTFKRIKAEISILILNNLKSGEQNSYLFSNIRDFIPLVDEDRMKCRLEKLIDDIFYSYKKSIVSESHIKLDKDILTKKFLYKDFEDFKFFNISKIFDEQNIDTDTENKKEKIKDMNINIDNEDKKNIFKVDSSNLEGGKNYLEQLSEKKSEKMNDVDIYSNDEHNELDEIFIDEQKNSKILNLDDRNLTITTNAKTNLMTDNKFEINYKSPILSSKNIKESNSNLKNDSISENAELYKTKKKDRIKLEKQYKKFFKFNLIINMKIVLQNLKMNYFKDHDNNQNVSFDFTIDSGLREPDSISNEKELRLDHRIKLKVQELMINFGVDSDLDDEAFLFNMKHKKEDVIYIFEAIRENPKLFNLEKIADKLESFKSKF